MLHDNDLDALVSMKLLRADQRDDPESLRDAVLGLVYRASDALAQNAGTWWRPIVPRKKI